MVFGKPPMVVCITIKGAWSANVGFQVVDFMAFLGQKMFTFITTRNQSQTMHTKPRNAKMEKHMLGQTADLYHFE